MTEFEFAALRVSKKRIVIALWNPEQRERIIAMRAFALFSGRGQWHGLGFDDWLEAKREISLAEDEVVLSESDERIDISISIARAEPGHMILSISPESVLVLRTKSANGATDQDAQIPNPV